MNLYVIISTMLVTTSAFYSPRPFLKAKTLEPYQPKSSTQLIPPHMSKADDDMAPEVAKTEFFKQQWTNLKVQWLTWRNKLSYDEVLKLIKSKNLQELTQAIKNLNPATKNKLLFTVISEVFNDDSAVVQILIKAGADVNAREELATLFGLPDSTPLHYAPNVEIAQELINAKADVNATDEEGSTPLHYARNEEIARVLINAKADVNIQNKKGLTPLHNARNAKVAQALIDNGAKVNAEDKYKYESTPLHYASNAKVAQTLIDNGAKVDAKNEEGCTPLHKAPNAEIAQTLINAKADVNATDENGWTPLHYSALLENKDVTQILIDNGANVNTKTKSGETPWDFARKIENPEVVKILEDAIAKAGTNSSDSEGNTDQDNKSLFLGDDDYYDYDAAA